MAYTDIAIPLQTPLPRRAIVSCVRVLLQSKRTLQFYVGSFRWEVGEVNAMDFQTIERATQTAVRDGLNEAEILLVYGAQLRPLRVPVVPPPPEPNQPDDASPPL